MRLLFLAIGIVLAFGLGVWGILLVVPDDAPQWIGVSLSMVWLLSLLMLATLASGRKQRIENRQLFVYGLLAAVLVEAFLLPLFIHHISLPKWAFQLAVLAIVGSVYLLSKYIERKKTAN